MPLFEQSIPINHEDVAAIVKHHWNLELKQLIKGSQNHTFAAEQVAAGEEDSSTVTKFAVRVTPDPTGKHIPRIEDEIFFVKYLQQAGIHHICAPVDVANTEPMVLTAEAGPSNVSMNKCIVRCGSLIVVVFNWAIGGPLAFLEYRWMLDEKVVRTVGRWLANCHNISRRFSIDHPEVAARIQRWDQIHEGVLAGSELHPDDEAAANDIQEFGVIHGDFNCSNYFYDDETDTLSVFDWDQTHRGWYLWDLAQACHTSIMLSEVGLPVAGTPVPQANPKAFQELIISGYESIAGAGSVDKPRLQRMVDMKLQFYEKFCRRAQQEGEIPPDMKPFIDFIVGWFDKRNAQNI
jgi:Ser/Thr protein kinase RdoA (MazF antagonist)